MISEDIVVSIVGEFYVNQGYRTWVHSQWRGTTDFLSHQIRLGSHYPDLIALSRDKGELIAVECKGEKKSISSRSILTAIGQALAYRQASNSQTIALPESIWRDTYSEIAAASGIGVYLIDAEHRITEYIQPQRVKWPNISQLQAIKYLLNLPFDASPEITPQTTRPEPYILATIIAREGEDADIFRDRLMQYLPSHRKNKPVSDGFVKNVVRSVVSLQLLSTRMGKIKLSSLARRIKRYYQNKAGDLDSAIQFVYDNYMKNRFRGRPSLDVRMIMGMVLGQHPVIAFLLSVLEDMRETQLRDTWSFPEVFEYLKNYSPWETLIYLTGPKIDIPDHPDDLEMKHLSSHLLDDTVRQLVHAGLLGEKSKPLQGSVAKGAKDVILHLL
ncbi:MAG: hypothetical protein ACFFER_18300 [Candidatus Thorarchaeota archaeon]